MQKQYIKEIHLFEGKNNLQSLKDFLRVIDEPLKIEGVFEYFLMDNNIEAIRVLLNSKKINLNKQDGDGMTSIMHVIKHLENKNDIETIKVLLEYGAKLNIKNQDGKSGHDFLKEKNINLY
jgi:ankyrin repeat protein